MNKSGIIAMLIILAIVVFSAIANAGCTYTDPNPFPNPLVLNNGDTLCITKDTTVNTQLTVKNGAHVRIYNSSVFRVSGSMDVQANAKVDIEDCESKLEIWGSYSGTPSKCEIQYYCDTCDLATSKPYELIWGANAWQEWCCVSPLPVNLLKFYGNNYRYYNIISWVTASEVNNDYFTLERSENKENWSSIGLIKGTNGFTLQYYDYLDYKIDRSYYYRLKQTNINGSFEYLSITIVTYRGGNIKKELFKVTPSGRYIGTGRKGIIIKVFDDGTVEKIIN